MADTDDLTSFSSLRLKFSSLAELVRAQGRVRGDHTAFILRDRRWTYAQVDAASSRIAQGLLALGVESDATVGALTRHCAECMIMWCAASKIGATFVPYNWRLSASELSHVVDRTRPLALLFDSAFAQTLGAVQTPSVRKMLTTDPDDAHFVMEWARAYPAADPGETPEPGDSAVRLFSSGTTGFPKLVNLSHANLLYQCEGWTSGFGYSEGDTVHLNVMPTFHVSGIVNALWMMYLGSTSVFLPRFEPHDFLTMIGEHGVTDMFIVPAMLPPLIAVDPSGRFDLSTLRSIGYGGAPIGEGLLAEAIDAFGCDFLQSYGATECAGTITLLAAKDHVGPDRSLLRSAGKPAAHIALRIVDPDTGLDRGPGEPGEIWVRSRQNMLGYADDPQATSQAFPAGRDEEGGWFRTGDGGYLGEGYLYIHDRIRDMIISGAENIYPAEVERALLEHPAIREAAAIGVPDAKWGETVKAVVALRPDSVAPSETEIIAHARAHLAHYKCPKSVDFVDALPRNASGKVLRRSLRERYWSGEK